MKKLFLLVTLLALPGFALSQQISPELLSRVTPEMMQQFQEMTPGQQQMIANQLGMDVEMLREQVEAFNSAGDMDVGSRGQPLSPQQPNNRSGAVTESGDQETQAAQQSDSDSGAEDSVFMRPLPMFGADLFDSEISTFVPVDNAPIPSNYILGPGDTLNVQLYGNENQTVNLTINREGTVSFPELGPLEIGGLDFESARDLILSRIDEEMIGVRAALSLGRLRAINIMVIGEAVRPGTYSVSALTTVTQALFVSGGVTDIGSLRHIQVRRGAEVAAEFDAYDLLLQGDTSEDVRLQSGDVVYIPAVDSVAQISGAVRRPATYELAEGETLADLIAMAGGMRANAYQSDVLFRTFGERGLQRLQSLDLTEQDATDLALKDGDGVFVSDSTPYIQARITVRGAVTRPGPRGWRPGMRVSDVFTSVVDDLKANDVDLNYALIVRVRGDDRQVSVLDFNLGEAIRDPDSASNRELMAEDEILVFDLPNVSSAQQVRADREISDVEVQESAEIPESNRQELLEPLITRLQMQADRDLPVQVASVNGDVKVPGMYPLVENATVGDLIRAAGGLQDSAVEQAELLRLEEQAGGQMIVEQIDLDLSMRTANSDYGFALRSRDTVLVRTISDWSLEDTVTLTGEVRFPGTYHIVPGETLQDVVQRAGGMKQEAFIEGAVFTREILKEREAAQAREFARNIRDTFAAKSMTQETSITSFTEISELAGYFENYEGLGRMVIDLPRIIRGDSAADLELLPGDTLSVPKRPESVTVVGAVHREGSHRYDPTLDVRDYLELSGGMDQRADGGAMYVLRADGSVFIPGRRSNLFTFDSRVNQMGVGDTIVVPVDTNYKDRMTFIRDVTQIAYQTGVSLAAIIAAFQ